MSIKLDNYLQDSIGVVSKINVEVEILPGFPDFKMIGISTKNTLGHKERLRFALKNSGYKYSHARQTINVTPTISNCNSEHLDLTIAIGVIVRTSQSKLNIDNNLFLGKLNLDGTIQSSKSLLAILDSINFTNYKNVYLPFELKNYNFKFNANIVFCLNLDDLIKKLNARASHAKTEFKDEVQILYPSFENIVGLEFAKKAILLSVAYRLKLLLIGFPGVGKTMLSKSSKNLNENYLEILPISPKSTFLKANLGENIFTQNPNSIIAINEVSELKKESLEALRYILDQPNKSTLIATMNPCRCGYFGHATIPCKCTPTDLKMYQKKLPPPFLDRFDVVINLYSEPTLIGQHNNFNYSETLSAREYVSLVNLSPNLDVNVSPQYLDPEALAMFKELTVKYAVNFRRAYKILNLAYYLAHFNNHKNPNSKNFKIKIKELLESIALQSYVIPKIKNRSESKTR